MKILQINAVNSVASTGQIVKDLNDVLLNKGFESVVAYSKGFSYNLQNEFKMGSVFDTKVHAFLSRLTGKQGYFSKRPTKKLLSFMDNYKPDIVVLHNLHANFINLPLVLKYLAKKDIATVAVIHDCWLYTGKCCHYTVENCYNWKNVCQNCPSLKKHNTSWFFDRTRKLQKDKIELFGSIPRLAVVGVSDWITNEVAQSPVFKNAKVFRRIYNWVDTNTFTEQPSYDSDDIKEKLGLKGKKVLLSVAYGWSKDKGINTILEMSEKLNNDEIILLVGDITSDIALNDNIVHIPTTNSAEELAQYYSLADVFIQPSLEETFGKVTAEALSCGTPVVCFNSTTTPELVGDDCGIVLDEFNVDSMLMAAREILATGKDKYYKGCSNKAVSLFSKEKNINEYFELFKYLIEG